MITRIGKIEGIEKELLGMDENFAEQFVYLALYDDGGAYIEVLRLSPVETERIEALKIEGYETVSHRAYHRFIRLRLVQPVQRKRDGCVICGKSSDETALYHAPFRNQGEYLCWACYHKQAIELGAVGFTNGIVGKNSGWTYQYTLPKAIETALYEIELENNIDMGITVSNPVDNGYDASMIVRNYKLYVKVADLSILHDIGHDDRIAAIEKLLKQLDFELLKVEAQ
jgi:hypothetical protein